MNMEPRSGARLLAGPKEFPVWEPVGGRELPSWNRRGSEPRNEASGVVLNKRERSEHPYQSSVSRSCLITSRTHSTLL